MTAATFLEAIHCLLLLLIVLVERILTGLHSISLSLVLNACKAHNCFGFSTPYPTLSSLPLLKQLSFIGSEWEIQQHPPQSFEFRDCPVSTYDELSDRGYISLPKSGVIESGQMVSKKVKFTYFDVYLSQTMWNHTKNSMKGLKQPTSVILQWATTDWRELFTENAENKGN